MHFVYSMLFAKKQARRQKKNKLTTVETLKSWQQCNLQIVIKCRFSTFLNIAVFYNEWLYDFRFVFHKMNYTTCCVLYGNNSTKVD